MKLQKIQLQMKKKRKTLSK